MCLPRYSAHPQGAWVMWRVNIRKGDEVRGLATMNFDFDESHVLLRKSVREFARAEIAPHAQRWDKEERFPMELVPKLASHGLARDPHPRGVRRLGDGHDELRPASRRSRASTGPSRSQWRRTTASGRARCSPSGARL
jgi:hypothetical protein